MNVAIQCTLGVGTIYGTVSDIGNPIYSHQEVSYSFIRDVRLAPKLNVGLNDEILLSILTNYISL